MGIVVPLLLILGSPTSVPADLAPVATLWEAAFPGPANQIARASAVAVSPSGDRVFVTGWSEVDPQGLVTAAYHPTTGSQLWATRDGNTRGSEPATKIVVSPAGDRVYVSRGRGRGISGYDTSSGQRVFCCVTGHGHDLELSPDGSVLYALGQEEGDGSGDLSTHAISTETGMVLWSRTYGGQANDIDSSVDLALSPDGTRVYITGTADHRLLDHDYVTLAYDAASGAALWSARYHGDDEDMAVALDASETLVFVTGRSGWRYTTLAYDAVTGKEQWLHESGTLVDTDNLKVSSGDSQPVDLELSPSGDTVYVSGTGDFPGGSRIVTVAIDAAGGNQRWSAHYDGRWLPNDHFASAIAVSQDGSRVYVSGSGWAPSKRNGLTSLNYASVGFDALTGVELWSATYDGPGNGRQLPELPNPSHDELRGMALSPDGSRLYVTGESWFGHPNSGGPSTGEYRTLAYCTLEGITDCLDGA